MKKFLSYITGTLFGIGYFPLMPGTFASAVATVVLYFYTLNFEFTDLNYNLLIIVFFFIGIVSGDFIEKDKKKTDPSFVVIDELIGILVTFWGIPLSNNPYIIYYLVAGFLLFRFFDILKPYPISFLESVRGGLGIMADDFMAGIFANFILKAAFFIITVY
ncbi:MAG: phosphatidylglycerophosphatase A family protein [Candidatus Muiribacteriota bacterium]